MNVDVSEDWCDLKYCTANWYSCTECLQIARTVALQMCGLLFIMQTSKYLSISATAMTLGQGHGNITQYICPDLLFVFPNIQGEAKMGCQEKQKLSRLGKNELTT